MSDIKYNYYATLDDIFEINQFIMKDQVTGICYIVSMRNGSLTSFCKCNKIEVTKTPDTTVYYEGEEADTTGMIITAVCEDGSTKEVTNYTCSPVNNGIITVTYTEAGIKYTTSFSVTTSISIKELLIDFDYTANSDGTYTITAWKQTLNGDPSTEMVIPDSDSIIVEVM